MPPDKAADLVRFVVLVLRCGTDIESPLWLRAIGVHAVDVAPAMAMGSGRLDSQADSFRFIKRAADFGLGVRPRWHGCKHTTRLPVINLAGAPPVTCRAPSWTMMLCCGGTRLLTLQCQYDCLGSLSVAPGRRGDVDLVALGVGERPPGRRRVADHPPAGREGRGDAGLGQLRRH